MYVSFNELPDTAKVWIYQSDRIFSETDKKILKDRIHSFTESWLVHGEELRASFNIAYDQFVILAADDVASGCSIDTSVKIIRQAGSELDINFFDRTAIAFEIGKQIRLIPLATLKTSVTSGLVTTDTPVFNNAIATLGELRESWPAPAGKTWVKRYFPVESIEK